MVIPTKCKNLLEFQWFSNFLILGNYLVNIHQNLPNWPKLGLSWLILSLYLAYVWPMLGLCFAYICLANAWHGITFSRSWNGFTSILVEFSSNCACNFYILEFKYAIELASSSLDDSRRKILEWAQIWCQLKTEK